jgi:hypothetical protein
VGLVTGDPDVVTGKQARNCEGGLATYDENALYIRLSESGRVKDDGNQRMYVYWRADQDKRGA